MSTTLARIDIRDENDLVVVRQRARLIASLLGFGSNDQTRISAAVSEIARNAYQYAGGGEAEFQFDGTGSSPMLSVVVRDNGPGIPDLQGVLDGLRTSPLGKGGIVGAKRLMDRFEIDSWPGKGTVVGLGKPLPRTAPEVTPARLRSMAAELSVRKADSPLDELHLRHRELLRTVEELRLQRGELEDTNRGVLALYTELEDKVTQLLGVDQLKSRFLSNMSHEFRTPLNAILALSRLLLDRADGELTDEQEKQVVFIRQAAEGLSALVNDLLDLARIEAGKLHVKPGECTLEEIFSGLRGMLKPLLNNPSLALVFEPPEGIPPLFTDGGKVAQILRNLLSNALKFTERGEIRVSAQLQPGGQFVAVAVRDTGIGIAPEHHERIFDEYMQVQPSLHGEPKGTGLGLPISRKLATLLGGGVSVGSELGKGSTFTVSLPVRFSSAGVPEARIPEPIKVLIIDDEAADRYVLRSHLAGTRVVVLEAPDGMTGLRMAEAEQPGVIFLNLMMPGMDGWEVLGRLESSPATQDIPVVICSSKVLDEAERMGLDQRTLALLSKTIASREAAREQVRQVLHKAAEVREKTKGSAHER